MHSRYMPYEDYSRNRLELVSLLTCTFTLIASTFLSATDNPTYLGDPELRGVVTICVLIANLVFVGFFIHTFVPTLGGEVKRKYWSWKIGKAKSRAVWQLAYA